MNTTSTTSGDAAGRPSVLAARGTLLAAACLSAVLAAAAVPAWSQEPAPGTPPAPHGDRMAELELSVGESRVLPAPGVSRIAVGSGQVVTASALDGKDVIVFANSPGTTTLLVWTRDGSYRRTTIKVAAGDAIRHVREVAAFLLAIPNAKVTVLGDKVVVEGEQLADADRDKIAELAKRYPLIVNFTEAGRAEQTVTIDVKVLEFAPAQLKELGRKWTAAGGAAGGGIWTPAAGGAANSVSGAGLGLQAQLKALEQSGAVALLAEPQLSTRSGDRSTFQAGGEIPYAVATAHGAAVQFKPYGIKLDIEPRIGRDGIIRALIESEVSVLDPSMASASGPALLTRRTRTGFDVAPGATIVLSGLLQRTGNNDRDRTPMLGKVPLLGALFGSARLQSRETELVVFITPRLAAREDKAPPLAAPPAQPAQRSEPGIGAQAYLSLSLQGPAQPAGAGPASRLGSCQLAAALPCPR
jgi:pilus assembly protein CpaC